MKHYTTDWPTQSVAATLEFRMKVRPDTSHWSWNGTTCRELANAKRHNLRKPLTAAELQQRSDARLLAKLAKIIGR